MRDSNGTKWLILGEGKILVSPVDARVGRDTYQCLLFEPVEEVHEVGIFAEDDDTGPYTPKAEDTVIVLGSIEAAEVLLHQVKVCLDEMYRERAKP